MSEAQGICEANHDETNPVPPGAFGPAEAGNTKTSEFQWRPPPTAVGQTLISGMLDEDIWKLVRSFNRQVSHVKAVPRIREHELDLNRTTVEQFPSEKLQKTIERFNTSVVQKVTTFFNHVTRLRSWKEPGRTGLFGAVYLFAWLSDFLIPVFCALFFGLVFFPPLRPRLFPPPPPPQVTQALSETKPSRSPTQEIATPAPQAEEEFQDAPDQILDAASPAVEASPVPADPPVDPDALAVTAEPQSLDLEIATFPTEETETSKKKQAKVISQTMLVLSDVTDVCEKISNLLSPSPPFDLTMARLQLAGVLVSACLVSLILSSYMIIKTAQFAVGFTFFGGPVIEWGLELMNNKVPHWKEYLDLEKTLLKGVPTNAQLTLALLRVRERNSNPLPSPPSLKEKKSFWSSRRKKSQMTITNNDQQNTASSDPQSPNDKESTPGVKRRKKWARVLKFVRRAIITAVKGHVAFDRALAIAGTAQAKGLLSLLDRSRWVSAPLGPLTFDAKFERKRGTVVFDSSPDVSVIYFTSYSSAKLGDDLRLEAQKKGSVVFQIPVTDIRELRKTEGLGWKGKLIIEMAAGSEDSADGLIINGIEPDQSFHLTGMRGRNQLFNRLVAVGAQFWEIH